ncbi:hypothetical protein BGZ65_001093, partial [Modicella reniformis]
MVQAKQRELENAFAMNEQLEKQLDQALRAQGTSGAGRSNDALSTFAQQRQELEQRLKKAQETIQILEGDNSVLEARLQDSEKKVGLLLEDMQNSSMDAPHTNSPLNSANLSGVHQQMHQQLARSLGQSSASAHNAHLSDAAARSGSSPHNGSRNGARSTGSSGSPSNMQTQKKSP